MVFDLLNILAGKGTSSLFYRFDPETGWGVGKQLLETDRVESGSLSQKC